MSLHVPTANFVLLWSRFWSRFLHCIVWCGFCSGWCASSTPVPYFPVFPHLHLFHHCSAPLLLGAIALRMNCPDSLTRHRLGCFCTHHSLGGGSDPTPPAISKTDGGRETGEAAFERSRRDASKPLSKIQN